MTTSNRAKSDTGGRSNSPTELRRTLHAVVVCILFAPLLWLVQQRADTAVEEAMSGHAGPGEERTRVITSLLDTWGWVAFAVSLTIAVCWPFNSLSRKSRLYAYIVMALLITGAIAASVFYLATWQ